jgi:hypothetical protein
MHLAAVAGAVACALAAGCGSVSAPMPSPPRTHTTARHTPPTAAGNRRLARAAATRLLAQAPVPAHAVRLAAAPRSLPIPAMGIPGVQSLVDASQSWRLPMTYRQAAAWLAAHGPLGLRRDGTEHRDGDADIPSAGYSYSGPAGKWGSAELDVAVAAAGRHSVLRVDALAIWLDPVPYRDDAPGKRLRLLASGNCPRTDLGVAGVKNQGAHLTRALLPAGSPVRALQCTYYGLNGHPWQLRSQQRLTAAQARQVAATMARKPLSHTVGSTLRCPLDDGSAEIIALAYPGRPDVDLWVKLNGCLGVSNGQIIAGRL